MCIYIYAYMHIYLSTYLSIYLSITIVIYTSPYDCNSNPTPQVASLRAQLEFQTSELRQTAEQEASRAKESLGKPMGKHTLRHGKP